MCRSWRCWHGLPGIAGDALPRSISRGSSCSARKDSKILRQALEAEQQPHHQHQDPYLQEAVLADHVMDEALQVVLVLVDVLPL